MVSLVGVSVPLLSSEESSSSLEVSSDDGEGSEDSEDSSEGVDDSSLEPSGTLLDSSAPVLPDEVSGGGVLSEGGGVVLSGGGGVVVVGGGGVVEDAASFIVLMAFWTSLQLPAPFMAAVSLSLASWVWRAFRAAL